MFLTPGFDLGGDQRMFDLASQQMNPAFSMGMFVPTPSPFSGAEYSPFSPSTGFPPRPPAALVGGAQMSLADPSAQVFPMQTDAAATMPAPVAAPPAASPASKLGIHPSRLAFLAANEGAATPMDVDSGSAAPVDTRPSVADEKREAEETAKNAWAARRSRSSASAQPAPSEQVVASPTKPAFVVSIKGAAHPGAQQGSPPQATTSLEPLQVSDPSMTAAPGETQGLGLDGQLPSSETQATTNEPPAAPAAPVSQIVSNGQAEQDVKPVIDAAAPLSNGHSEQKAEPAVGAQGEQGH
ncbi:hypothetical protein JCM10212_001921 [Sporobolomyces blumeae]